MDKTCTVADFVPFVEIRAPFAPDVNTQHAVREAVIEFMRTTRTAVDDVYVDVPCNELEVVIDLPECRQLVQVERVYLAPQSCGQLGRWDRSWQVLPSSEAHGYGWWIDDVGGPNATLWLGEASSTKQRLCIRYSWAIERDACAIPMWVYQDYADTIAAGAAAYLHTNTNVDGASVQFGVRMREEFTRGVVVAKTRKVAQYRARRLKMGNSTFFWG